MELTDRDRVARAAAELLSAGRESDPVRAAVRAAQALGLTGIRLPSPGRIRRHLALLRASLGQAAPLEGPPGPGGPVTRQAIADEVCAALDAITAGDPVGVVGAPGAFDASLDPGPPGPVADPGTLLNIRLFTEVPAGRIADDLRDLGYADPVVRSRTTAFGRIDELLFEENGVPIAVRVCPPGSVSWARRSLRDGARIRFTWWRA